MHRSENSLSRLLKGSCLNKKVLDRSIQETLESRDSLMHQYYNIIYFSSKSKKIQYRKDEKNRKNRKVRKIEKAIKKVRNKEFAKTTPLLLSLQFITLNIKI